MQWKKEKEEVQRLCEFGSGNNGWCTRQKSDDFSHADERIFTRISREGAHVCASARIYASLAFPLIFHRGAAVACVFFPLAPRSTARRPSCFRSRAYRKRPDVPRQSDAAEKSRDHEAWINREGRATGNRV